MTTYILVGSVRSIDRFDFEWIENQIYNSFDDLKNKLDVFDITKCVQTYTLHDFTTAVNDEVLQDFSDKWVGYVHVKN
jgi:hypothetical protein